MAFLSKIRARCAPLIAFALLASPAHAFISLNDGTAHIFATGSASIAYDSNIFAHAGGDGDYIYSASLLFEYIRRAGLIGVNASVALNASRFGSNTSENFNNPRFVAEFIKESGRTTGSFLLSAARESQADAVANQRTQSWYYDTAFNFKYPVIERYSFAGHAEYTDRVYDEPTVLTDLQTYAVGTDLLYALTSDRNLLAGYQFRRSDTSANSSFDDHSFTLGLTGRIYSKFSGSFRAGYEIRHPRGPSTDGQFRGLTASATVSLAATKDLNFSIVASRDVSVSANDQSVNTTSGSVSAQYRVNDRVSVSGNVGVGENRFLNALDAGRHDEYFTWGPSLKYKMNDHLDSSLSYVYDKNWSTFAYSDFTRHIVTLTLSSRW